MADLAGAVERGCCSVKLIASPPNICPVLLSHNLLHDIILQLELLAYFVTPIVRYLAALLRAQTFIAREAA